VVDNASTDHTREVLDAHTGLAVQRIHLDTNTGGSGGFRAGTEAAYDQGFDRIWLMDDDVVPAPDCLALLMAQDEACVMAVREDVHGRLVEMAATDFGASVTGVTLSTEQLAFAQNRTAGMGTDLRLQDYRDIKDAPFDAVCSIEMVEAVGREYWPTYFQSVSRLLKPGGRACVQSIVIDDQLFDRYIDSTDFIQQYIFPGGCLPCPREFRREAAAAGLEVVDEFAFGADYAETLRRWRESFLAQRGQILQLGFDERFMRIWEFYLAYCEAAFASANIDVVQYTLQKR
jgi:cyclopropane-fatty-acyl-phospholipid synthase